MIFFSQFSSICILGSRVEEIEQERERKKRELFKQMNEEKLAAEREANGDEASTKGSKDLETEDAKTSPPAEKAGRGKGKNIAGLEDDDSGLHRRKKSAEDSEGIDFDSLERTKNSEESDVKQQLSRVKVASLDDDSNKNRRRNKYDDGGDVKGVDSSDNEVSSPESSPVPPKVKDVEVSKKDEKDWRAGVGEVQIASLDAEQETSLQRRNKERMFDEKENDGVVLPQQKKREQEAEKKRLAKEEEKRRIDQEHEETERKMKEVDERTKRSELEERKKKLSREGGKEIVANLDKEDPVSRRRRKK